MAMPATLSRTVFPVTPDCSIGGQAERLSFARKGATVLVGESTLTSDGSGERAADAHPFASCAKGWRPGGNLDEVLRCGGQADGELGFAGLGVEDDLTVELTDDDAMGNVEA
jgi:hypothetical protein